MAQKRGKAKKHSKITKSKQTISKKNSKKNSKLKKDIKLVEEEIIHVERKVKKELKRELHMIEIILGIIVLIVSIPAMFDVSVVTGSAYILAILSTFWERLVLKKKEIARILITGALIAFIVGKPLPYFMDFTSGVLFSQVVMIITVVTIWTRGRHHLRRRI